MNRIVSSQDILRSSLILFFGIILLLINPYGMVRGATFTVTKTSDSNDSVCNADCSFVKLFKPPILQTH